MRMSAVPTTPPLFARGADSLRATLNICDRRRLVAIDGLSRTLPSRRPRRSGPPVPSPVSGPLRSKARHRVHNRRFAQQLYGASFSASPAARIRVPGLALSWPVRRRTARSRAHRLRPRFARARLADHLPRARHATRLAHRGRAHARAGRRRDRGERTGAHRRNRGSLAEARTGCSALDRQRAPARRPSSRPGPDTSTRIRWAQPTSSLERMRR